MFAITLNNVIFGLAEVLSMVITGYTWVIIISVLISWINPDPYNPIVRMLKSLTEPVFYIIRKHLPFTYTYGMDFSPIVVILVLKFLEYALVKTLFQISMGTSF